jgi:hypothetical protein
MTMSDQGFTTMWDANGEDLGEFTEHWGGQRGAKGWDRFSSDITSGLAREKSIAFVWHAQVEMSRAYRHTWRSGVGGVTLLQVHNEAHDFPIDVVPVVNSQARELRFGHAALSRLHRRVWLGLVLAATCLGVILGASISAKWALLPVSLFASLATIVIAFTWYKAGESQT